MSRKLHRSRRQSHPPQRRIPYSGGCSRHVTSRILRSTGRRGHSPQRYIPHSSSCFCGQQKITSLQTTVARSYSKCVALSVMQTIRWDVNGIHVPTIRNLIRREGSDYETAIIQITTNLSNLCPSMRFQISAFAISYPGQRRVPPLVSYI